MPINFRTVAKRLQRLKEPEQLDPEDVAALGHTKKKLLMMSRKKEKLSCILDSVRGMTKVPPALWIVDPREEYFAVAEARKLNIPIVVILDTNADPDEVDHRIPGNNSAIRVVSLLTRVTVDVVADGLLVRSETRKSADSAETIAEPLAEWERKLLEGEVTPAEVEEVKAEEVLAGEAPKQG